MGTWSWKRPFYTIAFVYGFFLLLALFAADKLIFQPPMRAEGALPAHFISFPSEDGEKIAAYYLPPAEGMPVLLWSHGNAEDLGGLYFFLKELNGKGYGVMAYDYPGYGFSSGKPTEEGCYSAIQAAYDHVTGPLVHPAERIIFAGQSVGTGPACYLAAKEEHAGVLLIAPFTSAFRTLTRVPLFPNDRFQNVERIEEMTKPLLIIHGTDDSVINHAHGVELHELSPAGEKLLFSVEGAGHNNLFDVAPEEIEMVMEEFAKRVYPR